MILYYVKVNQLVGVTDYPVLSFQKALPFRDWYYSELTSDIKVVNGDTCPETHPELLFYKPFYGVTDGCYCETDYVVNARDIENYPLMDYRYDTSEVTGADVSKGYYEYGSW